MSRGSDSSQLVVLGEIVGVYGVRGWVKLRSSTESLPQIFDYSPWLLRRALTGVAQAGVAPQVLGNYEVEAGQVHGKGLIAKLAGVNDRDQAAVLAGTEICIAREQLPDAGADDFYWADLLGLQVVTVAGVELGQVKCLFETGSNDVMVVQGDRERLIPWLRDEVVLRVDLEAGLIEVDWDPEF